MSCGTCGVKTEKAGKQVLGAPESGVTQMSTFDSWLEMVDQEIAEYLDVSGIATGFTEHFQREELEQLYQQGQDPVDAASSLGEWLLDSGWTY